MTGTSQKQAELSTVEAINVAPKYLDQLSECAVDNKGRVQLLHPSPFDRQAYTHSYARV